MPHGFKSYETGGWGVTTTCGVCLRTFRGRDFKKNMRQYYLHRKSHGIKESFDDLLRFHQSDADVTRSNPINWGDSVEKLVQKETAEVIGSLKKAITNSNL